MLSVTPIVVDTFDDLIDADDGVTSLREAVIHANTNAGDFEIQLQAGTYWLSLQGTLEDAAATGDLDILPGGTTNIVGIGPSATIIQAGGDGGSITALSDRVFDIRSGAVLTLEAISLTGGTAGPFGGGALRNSGGIVTIADAVLSGNAASIGGAVANSSGGEISVVDSTLSANTAEGGGSGIYNRDAGSQVTLIRSTLSGNTVEPVPLPYGSDVSIGGGGIFNFSGQVTLIQSSISGNTGGGIANVGGQVTIAQSIISGNTASDGGGIWNGSGGVVTLTESTVSDNRAVGFSYNPNYSSGWGGGIVNNSEGEVTITRSTLSGNKAFLGGGAIQNIMYGQVTLTQSTVSGNSTKYGGGTINNAYGYPTTTIRHSTITGNRDVGVVISSGGVSIDHSIVAGNSVDVDFWPIDVSGSFTDMGFNLIGVVFTDWDYNVIGPLDVSTVLDTQLKDNGGPTFTHALVAGSPAIDAGNPDFDPSGFSPPMLYDQRGEPFDRIRNGTIDIGAFEFQGSANQPPTIAIDIAAVIADEGQTATNSGTFSDPDLSDTVTINASVGTITQDAGNAGNWSWQLLTTDDLPTTTVTITATDSAGEEATVSFELTVDNVPPSGTLSPGQPAFTYGGVVTVSFSNQNDPSPVDTTAEFHYAYALDSEMLASANYATSSSSDSFDLGTLDAGTYTVFGRIIDKDDGYTQYELDVTVAPATLTVAVNDAVWAIGTPFPEFSVTYGGFVLDQDESVLGGTLAFTTAADETSTVGMYAVSASGVTSNNYDIDFIDGMLTVTPAIVAIDLRPASLNIDQNGAISLLIYGSSTFDVSQVSVGSLALAGVSIDVFNDTLVDADQDGTADLLLHFQTSDALKAALTAMYSDLLLYDYEDDGQYSTKQEALIALDGAFGEYGQEFQGTDDSTNLFLAGKSLKTLLEALGI